MRRLNELKLRPGEPQSELNRLAARKLGVGAGDIEELRVIRRSLDARRKSDIHWVYSVAVRLYGEPPEPEEGYIIEKLPPTEPRPVIVGFGPAGIFAALALSRAGLRPIVLERGASNDIRTAAVERFRGGGELLPDCNVQFGEGGAGAFSDGKLNTGIRDMRTGFILRELAKHGAPPEVCYDARPHVGTDLLRGVVVSLRREICALGGEVRWGNRLTRLIIENGAICGAVVASPDGEYELNCRELILAIGHSARDTFTMLNSLGVPMQPKAFSMGARIEHLQRDIDLAQYGAARGKLLPPAEYSLSTHLPNGRGVYTFCMCPGGEVIAAASEPGCVVTNGMSLHARAGENANSALLVGVAPEDFPTPGALGGMLLQRDIELRAFELAGGRYAAVSQTVGDFLAGKPSTAPGGVIPSYRPGVCWGSLASILPKYITDALADALPLLGRRLRGFDAPGAVLTGPETRSSSPLRILRNSARQSDIAGLYPCGEGAGYAGGITSAAVDGLRCAEALMESRREAL